MKNICILGSTGSIGTQTLDIIRDNGGYHIKSMAAKQNIKLLEKQLREFAPEKVCVYDENMAFRLKNNIRDTGVKVVTGMDGLLECAGDTENDMTVTALVGMIGVRPTIAAIEAGSDIALANKETLVTAGHLIIPLVKKHGIRLLPVDSEHSAIFQSLQGKVSLYDGYYRDENNVGLNDNILCSGQFNSDCVSGIHHKNVCSIEKIILTASGGPFRGKKIDELRGMKASDALKHPNWSMGRKVTIDSATMVNKGLEVMEAKWLFGVDTDCIEVVIQPQSILHSAVQFIDGGIIAELGMPDMKLPIQYALYYPDRKYYSGRRANLFELGSITFEEPDYEVFKGLRLAYRVSRAGGSLPTVYNAANEYAVSLFLDNQIGFTDIADVIEAAVNAHKTIPAPDINDVLRIEQETYDYAEEYLRKCIKTLA